MATYDEFFSLWQAELLEQFPERAAIWQALTPAALQAHHAELISGFKSNGKAFLDELNKQGKLSIELFPGVPVMELWAKEDAREALLKRCLQVIIYQFAGDMGLAWFDNLEGDGDGMDAAGLLDKVKVLESTKLAVVLKALLAKISPDMFGLPENWKEDIMGAAKAAYEKREELNERLQGILSITMDELLRDGTVTREELQADFKRLQGMLGSIIPDLMKQSMNITPAERAFADPRRQRVLERLRAKRSKTFR